MATVHERGLWAYGSGGDLRAVGHKKCDAAGRIPAASHRLSLDPEGPLR